MLVLESGFVALSMANTTQSFHAGILEHKHHPAESRTPSTHVKMLGVFSALSCMFISPGEPSSLHGERQHPLQFTMFTSVIMGVLISSALMDTGLFGSYDRSIANTL